MRKRYENNRKYLGEEMKNGDLKKLVLRTCNSTTLHRSENLDLDLLHQILGDTSFSKLKHLNFFCCKETSRNFP